jgi:hypothetical protein
VTVALFVSKLQSVLYFQVDAAAIWDLQFWASDSSFIEAVIRHSRTKFREGGSIRLENRFSIFKMAVVAVSNSAS